MDNDLAIASQGVCPAVDLRVRAITGWLLGGRRQGERGFISAEASGDPFLVYALSPPCSTASVLEDSSTDSSLSLSTGKI